ncbi:MAG: permease-like cell division protein FtsX [Gammaproteobacteria bacterium]
MSARPPKRNGTFAPVYLVRHAQVLIASLGRLYRNPMSTLMTAAVIGIALALPATLLVGLNNLQRLSGGWNGAASISVFLKQTVSDGQAADLASKVGAWADVSSARTITRDQALAEFRRLSGFGKALDALDSNPLPAVLVVKPARENDPAAVQALLLKLRQLPQTGMAQLDLQWVKRLAAIMAIGRRGVLVVAALLGLAVLLVVGNTIRLDIQNRHDEIAVTKLIGGTDAFIRRPFLYTGLWHGVLGAIIAGALVELAFGLLNGPVSRLATLYQSDFALQFIGATGIAALLVAGAGLGLAGSWLAVSRHLGDIEPT